MKRKETFEKTFIALLKESQTKLLEMSLNVRSAVCNEQYGIELDGVGPVENSPSYN